MTTTISKEMIDFICRFETGKPFGYTMTSKDLNGYDLHDADGHKTYGYGLLVHPITKDYMDNQKEQWSQSELECLFVQSINNIGDSIDKWCKTNNIELNQYQKDAVCSACYNFGLGFLKLQNKPYSDTVNLLKKNPNDPSIPVHWSHISDKQGVKYPGLIKRRQAESDWYKKL